MGIFSKNPRISFPINMSPKVAFSTKPDSSNNRSHHRHNKPMESLLSKHLQKSAKRALLEMQSAGTDEEEF